VLAGSIARPPGGVGPVAIPRGAERLAHEAHPS
jgi:hypothetical protein